MESLFIYIMFWLGCIVSGIGVDEDNPEHRDGRSSRTIGLHAGIETSWRTEMNAPPLFKAMERPFKFVLVP